MNDYVSKQEKQIIEVSADAAADQLFDRLRLKSELIKLNPALTHKNNKELNELLSTMYSLGYHWDEKKKCFHNKEIGVDVRTMGLDIFDSEGFRRAHATWSNPKYASGAKLARHIITLFYLIIIDLLIGWIFIPLKLWLVSLGVLISIFFIVRRIAHVRVNTCKSENIIPNS
jgi:hypothetical protein